MQEASGGPGFRQAALAPETDDTGPAVGRGERFRSARRKRASYRNAVTLSTIVQRKRVDLDHRGTRFGRKKPSLGRFEHRRSSVSPPTRHVATIDSPGFPRAGSSPNITIE